MSHVLHCGDCLDPVSGLPSLADKSVAHVLTDPPYSRDLYLKFRTNRRGASSLSHVRRNGGGLREPTAAYRALANQAIGAADDIAEQAAREFLRIAKRWIIVFHDAESGEMWRSVFGDAHIRSGVWVKTNPMPQVSGDRPAQGFESVEIAHPEGRKRWNGGGRSAVWVEASIQGNWTERQGHSHPCPKPVALMEQLVRDFTDPGDLVCDPFAGSATTAVACKRLGRHFIGWERDPQFHADAIKRIAATREQFELAAPRMARPRQLQLEGPGGDTEGAA